MDFYFSDDFLVQLVFQCPGAMENHRSTVFREKSVRHDTPYSVGGVIDEVFLTDSIWNVIKSVTDE